MKIALFEVEPWEKDTFQRLEAANEVSYSEEPLAEENADEYADAEIVSTFLYSQLDVPVLQRLRAVRMIATRSTGFDHIATDYANANDIVVSNVPRYGQATVAEHVFGLLLTISHNLDKAVERTRRGDFSQRGLQGFDLQGKTFGVVGVGGIGRQVIRIALGFGMSVLAYDRSPDELFAQELGFRNVSLEELLASSDVISLHVPSTAETHHFISERELDMMKDGVVLINTARGDAIDVKALLVAIAEGKVKAVGLDVLPEEPVIREEAELLCSIYNREHDLETLLADHILLRLRNVVITPHSAFNTKEAVERIVETTVENIQAFIGGAPIHVVGRERRAA
ncbi:MAG: hydroxyacid dehydrogenase [Actinobacteria bacterium]|nr:MAG: hydroxyacid dehydrogenase [Actinomycetota bacterium]